MFQLKWLWKNAKGYQFVFVLGMIFSSLTSVLIIVNPKISQLLVDKVVYGKQYDLLIPLLLVMLGVSVIKIALRFFMIVCMELSSQHTIGSIRKKLFVQLNYLDMDYYDSMSTGDLMTRMTGDLDLCRHTMAFLSYSFCDSIIMFLAAIVFLLSVNWAFTLTLMAITPAIFLVTRLFTKKVKPLYIDLRDRLSALNTTSQENIEGNRVVKAFAKEDYEIERFEQKNSDFMKSNLKAAMLWLKFWPVIESIAQMLTFETILIGGLFIINGTLTYGELLAFSGLSFALSNPMRSLGPLLNDLQRFFASANKIIELYYANPKIENSSKDDDASTQECKIKGDIEFKNVTFAFGGTVVFDDISISVKSGQTLAIMGPTGCGKTTFVNLINRFYDVNLGEVLVDGLNVKEHDLKNLRKSIGMATQDVFLFSDTVEGNVAYGDTAIPFEDVERFARLSDSHKFIVKMEEGYDTIVGERGVGLSGGQRQRLALARAIAVKSPILVLDDTTSALDSETERTISKNLQSLDYPCTKIIIAQRISSVQSADCIIVIKDGKILEKGTHQELLNNGDYYYDTYLLQNGDAASESIKEELRLTQN